MTVLTSVVLAFTLLGFFVNAETEIGRSLLGFQGVLVNWAVIIAAFAFILGFLNVLAVHLGKLTRRAPGWFYSAVLLISATIVLGLGLAEMYYYPQDGLWGPMMAAIFTQVIAPLQAAAAALLLFILTYAAFRMLRRSSPGGVFIFLLSALVVLVSQLPVPNLGPGLQELRSIWFSWLAIPGLRAVLIGVALGIAMTALRLIMSIDRVQG
jgi:hypothetical protein